MKKVPFAAILLVTVAHGLVVFLICLPQIEATMQEHERRAESQPTSLDIVEPPVEPEPVTPPVQPAPAPVQEEESPSAPTEPVEPVQPAPRPVQVEPRQVPPKPVPVKPSRSTAKKPPKGGRSSAATSRTNRVVGVKSVPVSSPTGPSANEIASILRGAPSSAPVDSLPSDQAILHDAFYSRWQPPPKAEVGNASPVVSILFDADGTIHDWKIKTTSGIPALDDSVKQAVRQVGKIPGLSRELLSSGKPVEISFVVEN